MGWRLRLGDSGSERCHLPIILYHFYLSSGEYSKCFLGLSAMNYRTMASWNKGSCIPVWDDELDDT